MMTMSFSRLVVLAVLALQTSAWADGFDCTGLTYGTRFQVSNETHPSRGTRNVNSFVVSDKDGKSIAAFNRSDENVIQRGAAYTATVTDAMKVDGDKNIADTKLREVSKIELMIYFNYALDMPNQAGDKFSGHANYLRQAGGRASENVSCIRTKKH